MTNPKYNIGDTVYLIESAKLGWLESYKVLEIRSYDNGWIYKFGTPVKGARTTTVGDLNDMRHSVNWEVHESELVNYCVALDAAIIYHENKLREYKNLQSIHCPEGTDN